MTKSYEQRSYGDRLVGYGEKPGIVVVDFQLAFTDPSYAMGGAPLIRRAVENTAQLLKVARRVGAPVASCYMAYGNEREVPYWKVGACRELFAGHPGTALDPAIYDPDYDLVVMKGGPSIFFKTAVADYFIKERVDTVIVTGCITSGCVRASVIDSFSHRFRTIIPEDCVGDHDEEPHQANLRDVDRRYADVTDSASVIEYLERWHGRNAAR